MVTRTQAIKSFLVQNTHEDLASLYGPQMECQVIVAQDHGERLTGEFQGVKWAGYTDGINVWKPFRIPRNAHVDPEYTDTPMNFDLSVHAEGIGMTGWDWMNRQSKWVAYDFDAIVGHSDKHSSKIDADELKRVREAACSIPWVTVRHSTSGRGLHLYVFVDDVPTQNHTEHAALARAILSKMSALTGYDFKSKVDICGGNMWVWHRKMKESPEGLIIIRDGDILYDVPSNWIDHLNVITGRSKKITHNLLDIPEIEDKFEQLSGQRTRVKLDEEHRKLITWLDETDRFGWWDADRHMLVTHTLHLKAAHEALHLRGIFETDSGGKNLDEQNCFCYPLRKGAWAVRRYSIGCKEHASWEQDGQGWTRTYLNREPDLKSAAAAYNGVEDPAGGFQFVYASDASKAALSLGANVEIPAAIDGRSANIKPHKDGKRIVIEIPEESHDDSRKLPGWLKKGKKWLKIFSVQQSTQPEFNMEDYDDIVRHVVTEDGGDAGWVVNALDRWNDEPLQHVKAGLKTLGLKPGDIELIVGSNIFRPWLLVNKPFQPEYPGERQWNRHSPQFNYIPSLNDSLSYPTWTMILNHVGRSLDVFVKDDKWCKQYGILTGADYLKCWAASLIQYPEEPLPYLFIYSEAQNTGKSIFHEALSLLFSPGYQRADHSLGNTAFNGELEGAVLCVIEETNLATNKTAYEKIKDWVTSRVLPIHKKMLTPYHVVNTTHWIQCANSIHNCPVFPGDTRITYVYVPDPPENQIAKPKLIEMLQREASDFLGAITRLELPESPDRLRIPVIMTADKIESMKLNRSQVEAFVDECCHFAPGEVIRLSTFFERFREWLEPAERLMWTKNKVSQFMPSKFPKGRIHGSPDWHWGNISFTEPVEDGVLLVKVGEKLMPQDEVERILGQ